MIDLYLWPTPNNQKITILLAELGVSFTPHFIDIGKNQQFDPKFLAVNPNNKVPALVDSEGPLGNSHTVIESGAILLYLAEKYSKFLPLHPVKRSLAIQWLMFQMANVGPMFGQAGFWHRSKSKNGQALERYQTEAYRVLGVLNTRLSEEEYFAGEYSIADMAIYPWVAGLTFAGLSAENYPHLKRWMERMAARPAVQKGMKIEKPN